MSYSDTLFNDLKIYLSNLKATPSTPIILYDVGPQLVEQGHSVEDVLELLFTLEADKKIEFIEAERFLLLVPIGDL